MSSFIVLLLLVTFIISIYYCIKWKIEDKKSIKSFKTAKVIYSINLFDELKEMEKVGIFRLYSYKLSENAYFITTSVSGELFKNGKIVSYFGKETKELKTAVAQLSEFIKKVDKLKPVHFKYQKIGEKIRLGE